MTNRNGTAITWNSENLPTQITASSSNTSSFSYAPDKHRYYQSAVINGATETTVYVGGYEAIMANGVTTYRHHLMADGREVAEIDLSNSGSSVVEKISYILSDHLGSVDVVTNSNGLVITDMSFGAFGNRREAGTWLPPVGSAEAQSDHNADRYGFTHQEMLDNVNLIHMNGRVYDPALGRFLSVDPVFEFPTNSQSLNPYSYVLNNPLSMTDPTGYVAACGTGKASCPDSESGSVTVKTTATELGSHIAVHGMTTITLTKEANGNTVMSASGNGFGLGQTAEITVGSHGGGGNGAQNTQSVTSAQHQPATHTDIGSPSILSQQMANISSCVYDPSCSSSGDSSRVTGEQLQQLGLGSAVFSDSQTGLRAALFENNDIGAYVLAFAGTYNLRDVEPSVEQLKGERSPQFDEAIKLTLQVVRALGGQNITVTGHSLGGAEAAAGALDAHVRAITFNAEGLSRGTAARYGLDMSEANSLITNYHTALDPLTIIQDIAPFLPDAAGRQVTLPGFHFHSISGVCAAMNTQC